MTYHEDIEDALYAALEHHSPPAEFTITLPLEHWVRIRDIAGFVFEVPEHRMTVELENAPSPWRVH